MRELYLYSAIEQFTAEMFVREMGMSQDEDVKINMNTPGGSIAYGWDIAKKMAEHPKNVSVEVGGNVASMGTILLLFANKRTASDVSKLMIHKASMGGKPVSELTDGQRKLLSEINSDVKAKMKAQLNEDEFQKVAGMSIDEMFAEGAERKDVWMSAKEAQDIGFVHEVVPIKTAEQNPEASIAYNVTAMLNGSTHQPQAGGQSTPEPTGQQNSDNNTDSDNTNKDTMDFSNMTAADLKANAPQLYKSIYDSGVNAERDRVQALMVYNHVDPKMIKEKIDSGENLSMKDQADFNYKIQTGQVQAKLENDSPSQTDTPAGGQRESKEEAEARKLDEEFDEGMGDGPGTSDTNGGGKPSTSE